MKKILTLLILSAHILLAQNDLRFDIDFSVFQIDSTEGIVEFYYSFSEKDMEVNSGHVNGQLSLIITNKDKNKVIINKTYRFSSNVDSVGSPSDQVGLLRYMLNEGKYTCTAIAKDLNKQKRIKTINFDVEIKKYDPNKLDISGLEVSSFIKNESNNKNSIFYKNTMEIIPNPGDIFGANFAVLFFYSELYNINKNIKSDKLKVEHILLNSRNKVIYRKTKYVPRKHSSIVDLGAIQVNKYVTGAYNLIVSVSDTISKVKVSSIKNVFIYNPSKLDTNYASSGKTNILLNEFAQMTIPELDEVFEQSKYVATQDEIDRWKHISIENGKREFLSKFWSSRDEDPFTPQNETMEKYFDRVRFADTHYSNISQKYGWKTDMGRVYILYGEPYEIERHPNDSNIKPYEIWTYDDIEGGVIFVFGDRFDTGNFRLLNSTKRGELEDPDWKKWLYAR